MPTPLTTKTRDMYVNETILFCNEMRVRLGLHSVRKLRKGKRRRSRFCPVAATISNGLDAGYVAVEKNYVYIAGGDWRGEAFALPQKVAYFVQAFDRGRLPEFDVERQ